MGELIEEQYALIGHVRFCEGILSLKPLSAKKSNTKRRKSRDEVYSTKCGMLNDLFDEFIVLSTKLRKEYLKSLGEKASNWEEMLRTIDTDMPYLFQVTYSKVSGTRRDIQKQELMDFIPGYRLIHISELNYEKKKLNKIYNYYNNDKIQKIIPYLTNYSSDFICYGKMTDGRDIVVSIMHDEQKLTLMHESIEKFFETICEFYKDNVYFLDTDGYLDYDVEREGEVGAKINENITYWIE